MNINVTLLENASDPTVFQIRWSGRQMLQNYTEKRWCQNGLWKIEMKLSIQSAFASGARLMGIIRIHDLFLKVWRPSHLTYNIYQVS